MNKQVKEWEVIFPICIPNKGLKPKTYKEIPKIHNKKTKMREIWTWVNRHCTNMDIQIANKHIEAIWPYLSSRKCKRKWKPQWDVTTHTELLKLGRLYIGTATLEKEFDIIY